MNLQRASERPPCVVSPARSAQEQLTQAASCCETRVREDIQTMTRPPSQQFPEILGKRKEKDKTEYANVFSEC